MQEIHNFNSILKSFKIKAYCDNYQSIDNYFFYDLKLNPTAKVKDIKKFSDEISLALQTPCKPSVKILHQQGVVRLEFINNKRKILKLFPSPVKIDIPKGDTTCFLGNQVNGEKVWMDLSNNPHMLVAGTTGSGKTTLLHNIIGNLLSINKSQLYLIDPKNLEFAPYENKFDNVLVCYDYNSSLEIINHLIELMDLRYNFLRSNSASKLEPQVLIIDEFADLILQDKDNLLHNALCKLSQKCRAAKIHIILATQRPSHNIINGSIKANFPSRISCKVTSHVESKIILDSIGAENLLGYGDALLRDNLRNLERFQVAYTNAEEIIKLFGKYND